jgi:hypothetical protein
LPSFEDFGTERGELCEHIHTCHALFNHPDEEKIISKYSSQGLRTSYASSAKGSREKNRFLFMNRAFGNPSNR